MGSEKRLLLLARFLKWALYTNRTIIIIIIIIIITIITIIIISSIIIIILAMTLT